MIVTKLLSFRIALSVAFVLYLIIFIWVLVYGNCNFGFWNGRKRETKICDLTQVNKSGSSKLLDSSYAELMQNFPWDEYKNSVVRKDLSKTQHYTEKLLLKTVQLLLKDASLPANATCNPPPVTLPKSLVCNKLLKSRKVGVLLQFSFNVDALEVHLHELDELVDKFFIIESSRGVNTYLKSKPLLWDSLKYDERFSKFVPKIVHFIVDDGAFVLVGEAHQKSRRIVYSHELLLERMRWLKFLHWNSVTNFFGPEDLIGFGDSTEIPDRSNVLALKTCKFYAYSVDIGIWSPASGLETISQTEFPIKGRPYTLGSPTFWTVQAAVRYFTGNETNLGIPSITRGKSPAFLLGGMRMSNLNQPLYQIVKLLTTFNLHKTTISKIIEIGELYKSEQFEEGDEHLESISSFQTATSKTISVREFRSRFPKDADQLIKIPWFVNCNIGRYSNMKTVEENRTFLHYSDDSET